MKKVFLDFISLTIVVCVGGGGLWMCSCYKNTGQSEDNFWEPVLPSIMCLAETKLRFSGLVTSTFLTEHLTGSFRLYF